MCYNVPHVHPFISAKEKDYLAKEVMHRNKDRGPIPWKDILTSARVWATTFAQVSISLILVHLIKIKF